MKCEGKGNVVAPSIRDRKVTGAWPYDWAHDARAAGMVLLRCRIRLLVAHVRGLRSVKIGLCFVSSGCLVAGLAVGWDFRWGKVLFVGLVQC
jgi:hypothetical protein